MVYVRSRFMRTLFLLSFVPIILPLGSATAAQLTLGWTDMSNNEDGFRVERKAGTTGTFAQLAAVGADVTAYADGSVTGGATYCYRVRAYNTAGDSSYTNEACGTASADTQAPVISITAPANGATVSGSSVTISASTSDNVGVIGVQFLLDGNNLGSEDTTSPYSLSWDTIAVTNGSHTLTARARDAAGNQTTSTAITVTVSNTAPPPPDPSGLVAAYSFDEGSGATVTDSSPAGNTGTVSGASWTTQGKFTNALSFDGGNDYVSLNTLDINGSELTLAAWIKVDTFGIEDARIISKATGINEADHYWMLSTIDSNGPKLRFRLKTNGATTTLIASSGNLTPGVWTYVGATYDGQQMRLYKDGVEVGSLAKSGTISTNSTVPAWIGGNPPSATSRPFDGSIDEVRIYNKALSTSEIQTLMTTPVGAQPPLPTMYPLTATKTGTGSGTVSSNPAGINCGATCTASYTSDTAVTLTATPAAGSTFVGWSGDADCSDGSVTMTAAKSCTATFTLQSYALTVTKAGTGSGAVSSSPAGINCGATCTAPYTSGAAVTLTATPAAGSTFAGWSGDADCSDGSVILTAAKSCTATFTLQSYALTVTKAGTGSGTVSSSPAGLSCGATCTASYTSGTAVTLTATPAAGSTFAGWSGDADCSDGSVTMTAAKTCTATFNLLPPTTYSLTVTKTGTGSGTVTSGPTGINCGATCSASYTNSTVVTLTATPAAGSTFAGWSGDADCTDGSVSVTAAKTCTATFLTAGVHIGIYRPGTGQWFLDVNGNGAMDDCSLSGCVAHFGESDELPVVGDWDGTGTTKLGVFNPNTRIWRLDRNGNDTWETGVDLQVGPFGQVGDWPVVGDWDGSGITRLGVKRPTKSRWELDFNGNGKWNGCTVDRCGSMGGTVVPLAGDWNGLSDGQTKDMIGFFLPGKTTQWKLDLNGNNAWNSEIDLLIKSFGQPGDLPVVGDWDGSGTTKIGVFDPSTGIWELDTNGNGKWDGCAVDTCLGPFGQSGDLPVVGKW